jgi:hypothetical protein
MTPYHEQVFQSWMEQTATGREFHPSPENFQRLEDAFIKFKMQSFTVANLVTVAEKMQRDKTWLYVTKTAYAAQEQMRAEQAARDERAEQHRIQQAVAEDARENQPPPSPKPSPEEDFERRKAEAFAEFEKPISQTESLLARGQRVAAMRENWMRKNLPPLPVPSQQAHPDTIRNTREELALRRARAERQAEERSTPPMIAEPTGIKPQRVTAPPSPVT